MIPEEMNCPLDNSSDKYCTC